MLPTLVLFCASLLFQVEAEKLHLPVRVENVNTRSDQRPLGNNFHDIYSQVLPDAPLYESGLNLLTTHISIGTPPQTFSVILSLYSRDLFVISVMSPEKEFESHNHYNSSLSSTHVLNETHIQIPFLNALSSGLTSQDHLTLGSITVKDQLFAEAFMVRHGWSTDEVYWDGILGLGSKNGNSSMGTGNLVTAMYRQGLIEANMFSLTVPRDEGDIGQLVLGGMSDDVVAEEVKWIPVSNKTFTVFDQIRSGWQVSASSVTVGDGTKVNSTLLPNATAWIETEVPFLLLPEAMVDDIHDLIHARQMGWSPFYSVPKGERHEFPDIVFKLGGEGGEDHEDVRITGYDYTICDGSRCMSLLMGMYVGGGAVVLGGGFLRAVSTGFDLERNKVGFFELNNRE